MTIATGPQNEARLLREADCYMLASHFFWGLWAVVNAPVSSIPFGYWVSYLPLNLAFNLSTIQHYVIDYANFYEFFTGICRITICSLL